MNEAPTIGKIREMHNRLYEQALKEGKALVAVTESGKPELSTAFRDQVESLLKDMNALSAATTSFEEYRWLGDTAVKWQLVFSSVFNLPKIVQLELPKQKMVPPVPAPAAPTALSEEEIKDWLKKIAEFVAYIRIGRTGQASTEEEMRSDSHIAEVVLASEILDQRINFAGRMGSGSYWRLEQMWLKEVKCLTAYFNWQRRGNGFDPVRAVEDYYQACEHIRDQLVKGTKGLEAEFKQVKAYLEKEYLTNGKVDQNKSEAKTLIRRKAERIWERMRVIGRATEDLENWVNAETYVNMFYESIIPAVMEDDSERVRTVLKAFQYSKATENKFWVINCFEAALAIYFLNARTVQKLWDDSEKQPRPTSTVESVVEVSSWPETFEVPEACRGQFRTESGKITFKGVMTPEQKEALLSVLPGEGRTSIEDLYGKSRLIHRETTL